MSTRISDESLLLSKYTSNSSNKAAEVEKTASSTTTSGKTTSNTAGSKYDSLVLSSQTDPYVYNTYNSAGEYEATPSLIDYLDDDGTNNSSSSLFDSSSSASDNDALKLLGAAGGNTVSLVDFLDNGNSSSASDNYSAYFSKMSEASATKTNALIEQALEKMKEKEASSSKKTDKTTSV